MQYMAELAAHDAERPEEEEREVASDEEYSDESEPEEDDKEGVGARTGEEESMPEVDKLRIGDAEGADAAAEEHSEDEEDEEDEEEDGSEGDSDVSDADSTGSTPRRRRQQGSSEPRIGRRPARQNRDVETIVSSSLSKQKVRQERRHHGKKPVSANVLGRQRGSKKKQNANQREARAATKSGRGEAFF